MCANFGAQRCATAAFILAHVIADHGHAVVDFDTFDRAAVTAGITGLGAFEFGQRVQRTATAAGIGSRIIAFDFVLAVADPFPAVAAVRAGLSFECRATTAVVFAGILTDELIFALADILAAAATAGAFLIGKRRAATTGIGSCVIADDVISAVAGPRAACAALSAHYFAGVENGTATARIRRIFLAGN